MEELLEMSSKELDRYRILCEVKDKRISQQRGAELLGLSTRQIRNLLCDLKVEGPKGLISKKRGKPGNRSYHLAFKQNTLAIIGQHYEDFGPTLISEKLREKHGLRINEHNPPHFHALLISYLRLP